MNRVYRGENNGYRTQMEGRWDGREDLDERMRGRGRRDEIDDDWNERGMGRYGVVEARFGGRLGQARFGYDDIGFGPSESRFGRGHLFERAKRKITGPKNYQRSDERIREDLCDRLAYADWIDASDVEVQVAGAEVALIGTVRDRAMKHLIEDVADSILGVKDVHNQIRIERDPENREGTAARTTQSTRERTPRA